MITFTVDLLHTVKMSLVPFDAITDFSTVLKMGPVAKGMNGTLFLEAMPGHSNLFQGAPAMKQSYHIKPQGLNAIVKPGDKFEVNLQVKGDECKKFLASMEKLEDFVLSSLFARKGEVLPKKASVIHNVDALRILFQSGKLIKTGADDKNGGKYPDNLRLKVVGEWGTYIKGTNNKTIMVKGSEKTMIDSCEWQVRTKPVSATETHFYLWVRCNTDGKDVYTDKIVEDGVQRLVGPQDCKPGCLITPIFSLSHVYVNEGIGIVGVARALYIKAAVGTDDTSSEEFSASSSRREEVPLLAGAVLDSAETVIPAGTKRARTDE